MRSLRDQHMMKLFKIDKVINDGFIRAETEYGFQLWSRTRSRQQRRCSLTGQPIEVRDTIWMPMTNANNRADRIRDDVMQKHIAEHQATTKTPSK
jgi:hypothetical protein